MLKNTIILLTVIIITSCTTSNQQQIPHQHTQAAFGIWQFNENTCTIEATKNNILIKTDGRMSAELVYFKIKSQVLLARTPSIRVTSLNNLPIRVEGTGRYFSFEIPYTPEVNSKLMNEKSLFVIDYRIQNINEPQKISFNTKNLSAGISYLSKHCF